MIEGLILIFFFCIEEIPKIEPVCEPGGVVRLLKAQAETRRQKMLDIGLNRRALCARQDLVLR